MSDPTKNKPTKTELIAEYESYPKYPGRFDKKSAKEYEEEGFEQACDYFERLEAKFQRHKVSMQEIRERFDRLGPTEELKIKMSDFWLRLTSTEGRWRRNHEPPVNPFPKTGRSRKAPQGKILAWDQEWRKIAAFQAVKKVYEKAGAAASIGAGEALRTQMLWMTASGGAVIGNLSGMPSALLDKVMVHPEKLSVHGLTLEQALRRKWVDAEERVVWMERFEHASQALVSELKEMVLSKVAADTKPGRPRTPEKDRIF